MVDPFPIYVAFLGGAVIATAVNCRIWVRQRVRISALQEREEEMSRYIYLLLTTDDNAPVPSIRSIPKEIFDAIP